MDSHDSAWLYPRTLPPAVLAAEETDSGDDLMFFLAPADQIVGRGSEADIVVDLVGTAGISRRHARIAYSNGVFAICDLGSTNGTHINGRKLDEGVCAELRDGDRIVLGENLQFRFLRVRIGTGQLTTDSYREFLQIARELNSFDLKIVVERALALLRLVSGVERGYLVGDETHPRYSKYLTSLDDPALQVSRSTIRDALSERKTITRTVDSLEDLSSDLKPQPASIQELSLRRIWVSPIFSHDGTPVAVVYLDSAKAGRGFDSEVEGMMEAVVEQIGLALSNAVLHEEVVEFNRHLEQKVDERTRQLEESRLLLIGQDRLATLGRLVAAIAHELNNPAGAIASMSTTLDRLVIPILETREKLAAAFPDTQQREQAKQIIERSLSPAAVPPADTRSRRQLTNALESELEQYEIPNASAIAQRLGRAGVPVEVVGENIDLLRTQGTVIATLTERVYSFGRGVQTIEDCGANIARIVEGLKQYAHLDASRVENADIHRSIDATFSVLSPRIPNTISVETTFDQIAPFPHCPGELTQVWTNLVDNAVRAMGDSGTLAIETHDDGDTVRVCVADDGPGVPAEMITQVFELDVTTRGPGAGLGLGLPICRTIVEKNHNGQISVVSAPGKTVFSVIIPKDRSVSTEER